MQTVYSRVDVADLDTIYLSYDEPQKEEFWVKIKHMIPWAKRVDGVKGTDTAHKAAAAASDTDRFIIIDGDNLPDPAFFNQVLEFQTSVWEKAVYRWRARNVINGLSYGNGGISCWTKEFVENMSTHENSDGSASTAVEFCFDPLYWAMHDCYSTTYPNGTPKQAWRAGFREGVKMCLDRGRRPTLSEFDSSVHARNLDNLSIWHNVGTDVENGIWAIAGARQGTHMTMLQDWDYTTVQDFDQLDNLWQAVSGQDPLVLANSFSNDLSTRLGLPVEILTPGASKFFKQHVGVVRNKGIMVREADR